MAEIATPEKTQKHLQVLSEAFKGTQLQIQQFANRLDAVEIADLLESLPPAQRALLWESVPAAIDGEVLSELNEEIRAALIKDMDTDELKAALESLALDDQADLLRSLPEAIINETLQSLDKQNRLLLEKVLSYPEEWAGSLITTDSITVRANSSVEVVKRYLKNRKLPHINDCLVVVNRQNKYLGVVYINDLLIADNDITMAEIIDQTRKAIPVDLPLKEVVYLFQDQDLISAPVVDTEGKLLGRITIDDVVDIMQEQATHVEMGRAGLSEDDDIFAPIVASSKKRALWLGINLLTAFLAAWVIGLFEATLEELVALAVLMPIVASMGGITGTQTLTIVIRGLALGQLGYSNTRWLLFKEIGVSFLNSLLWATTVASVAILWFHNYGLALIIAIAIIINMLIASLSGVFIPIILSKLKIDPALAGGVILTTVTDVVGFFAFLGLASLFLLSTV